MLIFDSLAVIGGCLSQLLKLRIANTAVWLCHQFSIAPPKSRTQSSWISEIVHRRTSVHGQPRGPEATVILSGVSQASRQELSMFLF